MSAIFSSPVTESLTLSQVILTSVCLGRRGNWYPALKLCKLFPIETVVIWSNFLCKRKPEVWRQSLRPKSMMLRITLGKSSYTSGSLVIEMWMLNIISNMYYCIGRAKKEQQCSERKRSVEYSASHLLGHLWEVHNTVLLSWLVNSCCNFKWYLGLLSSHYWKCRAHVLSFIV